MKKAKIILLLIPLLLFVTGCESTNSTEGFLAGWNELSTQRNLASTHGDIVGATESAVTNGSNQLMSVLGYIWKIGVFLSAIAFIISVYKFGTTGDKPAEHEKAQKGISVSLIVLAISGSFPFILKLIINILHAFGSL